MFKVTCSLYLLMALSDTSSTAQQGSWGLGLLQWVLRGLQMPFTELVAERAAELVSSKPWSLRVGLQV